MHTHTRTRKLYHTKSPLRTLDILFEETGKMCFSSLRTTEVLWRAGCACRHQSAFHKKHNDTANEIKLLEEGFEYTDKAVKINGDNWQAQKW